MGISIHARKTETRRFGTVTVPLNGASRIAGRLGLDEQIELDIEPAAFIEALARAASLGFTDAVADAMRALAREAHAANRSLEWYRDYRDEGVVQTLAVSSFERGEPEANWSETEARRVFAALDLPFDRAGEIEAGRLAARCAAADPSDFDLSRRIHKLHRVALWAQARGLAIGWS